MNAAERSSAEEIVRSKYGQLSESMHERLRRHWAASEAEALGYGGIAVVSRATGIAPSTIGEAHREADDADKLLVGARSRRAGGGRPRHEVAHPTLLLLALIDKRVNLDRRGDQDLGRARRDRAASASRLRKLLPSMAVTSAWWMTRSMRAVADDALGKIVGQSAKARLVVSTRLFCS